MKKNLLSILALILAAAALALAVFGTAASRLEAQVNQLNIQLLQLQARVDALEAENAQLQNQPDIENTAQADGYAELVLNDWSAENGMLTLDIFARAMLPAGAEISDARLLLHTSEASLELPVPMQPGEADSSFEGFLTDAGFALPQLRDGDELELELTVTFTGGNVLHAYGVSWYLENGQLCLVSG